MLSPTPEKEDSTQLCEPVGTHKAHTRSSPPKRSFSEAPRFPHVCQETHSASSAARTFFGFQIFYCLGVTHTRTPSNACFLKRNVGLFQSQMPDFLSEVFRYLVSTVLSWGRLTGSVSHMSAFSSGHDLRVLGLNPAAGRKPTSPSAPTPTRALALHQIIK